MSEPGRDRTVWTPAELDIVVRINEQVEHEGSTDNVDANRSSYIKQFFKTYPLWRSELYQRTMRNLHMEYDEAMGEDDNLNPPQ